MPDYADTKKDKPEKNDETYPAPVESEILLQNLGEALPENSGVKEDTLKKNERGSLHDKKTEGIKTNEGGGENGERFNLLAAQELDEGEAHPNKK